MPRKVEKIKVPYNISATDTKIFEIDATICGVFALHKRVLADGTLSKAKKDCWTITHIPTGLVVLKNLHNRKKAFKLVKELRNLSPNPFRPGEVFNGDVNSFAFDVNPNRDWLDKTNFLVFEAKNKIYKDLEKIND